MIRYSERQLLLITGYHKRSKKSRGRTYLASIMTTAASTEQAGRLPALRMETADGRVPSLRQNREV